MIFVTGGRAQGKTDFALELWKMLPAGEKADPVIADGRTCTRREAENCGILIHLEEYVRRGMEAGRDMAGEVGELCRNSGISVICADEVGLGIVPADPLLRRFRDEAGRCSRIAAAQADEVYRVVCGIPACMKKSGR